MDMAHSAVEMLAENYKTMFMLDNARNILLDLAKECSSNEKLAEATDKQYGADAFLALFSFMELTSRGFCAIL